MDLLKRENWWIWLFLTLFGQGLGVFVLAALLGVFSKDAWYAKWYYWLIGVICCFIPALIMFSVFSIQISVQTAKKLEIPGSEVYGSPYTWILCLIIPIIGWIMMGVMNIYLTIWNLVMLYRGAGEKFIKE